MDIRSINRVFAFNKAYHLFNKSTQLELNGYDFNCLVSLYHLQDPASKGVNLIAVFDHLSNFKRTMSLKHIQDTFKRLSTFNLVNITGKYPTLYSLTFEGNNMIIELENRIRSTRYDK